MPGRGLVSAVINIAACSYCGSPQVYPKHWVQGFFPGMNAERQIYRCKNCDREGMLLFFDTEEERRRFEEECRQGAASRPP